MSSQACRGACPEPGRRNLQIPRLVALGRDDKKGTTSFLGFYYKWHRCNPTVVVTQNDKNGYPTHSYTEYGVHSRHPARQPKSLP